MTWKVNVDTQVQRNIENFRKCLAFKSITPKQNLKSGFPCDFRFLSDIMQDNNVPCMGIITKFYKGLLT